MPIARIAHSIPAVRHSAREIAEITGAEEKFIVEKIGLRTRYVLGEHETGVGLAADACRKLFRLIPELEGHVDLIVFVTQTPDHKIPHNSALLVRELSLLPSTAAFDINLGCSGYVYGLMAAEGFLATTGMQNALLVTCDPYSRIMSALDRDTNCIFGDAATVTWVSRSSGRSQILSSDFGTVGDGAEAIMVAAGGASSPLVSLAGDHSAGFVADDLRLRMKGRDVFNMAMKWVPASIDRCIERAGVSRHEVSYFVLHQASRYLLESLARRCQIPTSKLAGNMDRFGNTVSSSIPLLLSELDVADALDDSIVLLAGFGVGFSWSTAVVRFCERKGSRNE